MASSKTMMEQYLEIKAKYKNCLLLFRLGDFYELFFNDALVASKILDIALTSRRYGGGQTADMCGVPYHSADSYIAKLINAGQKIAICEQVEDAKFAKGLVKREVIRVITPGTVIEPLSLDERKNNYICSVFSSQKKFGLSFSDITTGEFKITVTDGLNTEAKLLDEIEKYKPSEIICNKSFLDTKAYRKLCLRYGSERISQYDEWTYNEEDAQKRLTDHFKVFTLDSFGLKNNVHGISAGGALLAYLQETQKNALAQVNTIESYAIGNYMTIDFSSRRNLELTQNLADNSKTGTLLWALDYTKTAMGARLLRRFIEQPLTKKEEIENRLESVGELVDNPIILKDLQSFLTNIYDLERLVTKLAYQNINARDLAAIRASLKNLPVMKEILLNCNSSYLKVLGEELDTLEDYYNVLENSIKNEDLPITIREGGIIKSGYNSYVDSYREAKYESENWIKVFVEKQREETGIKNLKVNSNRVFGYYMEVTKANMHLVPDTYIRKQTLTNGERYTNKELQEIESKTLGAEEKLSELEYQLFCEVRDVGVHNIERLQKTAYIISTIDVMQSFAQAAESGNYCRPYLTDENLIDIRNARHPVVEKLINEPFIDNDIYLDNDQNRLLIITGPNMAGKSTYMRQTALIILMAQIGSFVPAQSCILCPVDKIFTRAGASDNLASGQSTFMVEMAEVANILNNATEKSLVILDEIGRGTSTFDGLSIAWAVLEYIIDKNFIGAKTLFATHYHELTELEDKINGIKNFCFTVKEIEDDIIFLRKIKAGGAGRSLGVAVAKLAGLPEKVIKRSKEILSELNVADIAKKRDILIENKDSFSEDKTTQIDFSLISKNNLVDRIINYNIDEMTPIKALELLYEIQNEAKNI